MKKHNEVKVSLGLMFSRTPSIGLRGCSRHSWTADLYHTMSSDQSVLDSEFNGSLCASMSSSPPGLHSEFKTLKGKCYFKDNLVPSVGSMRAWVAVYWRRPWARQWFQGWPGQHNVFKDPLLKQCVPVQTSIHSYLKACHGYFGDSVSSKPIMRYLFPSTDYKNYTNLLFMKYNSASKYQTHAGNHSLGQSAA
jgi:hypothetical protein